MSTLEIWILILVGGAGTFLLRWSFIALSGIVTLPRPIQDALQYVPAAVLAAIVLPEVLVHDQQIDLSPDNMRMFAALIAAVVAWRTRSILFTMIVGMAALWALNALSGYL